MYEENPNLHLLQQQTQVTIPSRVIMLYLVFLFLFVFSISVFGTYFLLLNNSLSSEVILNVKKYKIIS